MSSVLAHIQYAASWWVVLVAVDRWWVVLVAVDHVVGCAGDVCGCMLYVLRWLVCHVSCECAQGQTKVDTSCW